MADQEPFTLLIFIETTITPDIIQTTKLDPKQNVSLLSDNGYKYDVAANLLRQMTRKKCTDEIDLKKYPAAHVRSIQSLIVNKAAGVALPNLEIIFELQTEGVFEVTMEYNKDTLICPILNCTIARLNKNSFVQHIRNDH